MRTGRTYEERVGEALDALYDGALLLTGSRGRAEALVVDVVLEGAAAFRTERPDDFRSWLVARMCKRYLDFVRERGGEARRDDAGRGEWPSSLGAGTEPAPSVGPPVSHLFRLAVRMEASDPARFAALVRSAVADLPLEGRAAMWLVGAAQVGYKEAAEAIGVDRQGLRDVLFRARRELHERLADRLKGEEGGAGRSRRGP